MGSKKLKLADEKVDRISDLPDCLIHHILSFLPSTKQAFRTGILSKRWQNQWTQVPILIFNFDGMSNKSYVNFIDNTLILHDCSKINKFCLYINLFKLNRDPKIASKISLAISKNVEDLDLKVSMDGFYLLPEFLFNNASLVRLKIAGCSLVPNGNINWGFLTLLIIRDCELTEQTLARILSGCPLLESLELDSCSKFDKIVIASKSLKRLRLSLFTLNCISVFEISCPKLKKLSLNGIFKNDLKLFAQAIESVLSGSLLLESMSIRRIYCHTLDTLVIASNSLKRLVVRDIGSIFYVEISCPKLEILKLVECLNVKAAKLLNLPSSLCATIDFHQFEELPITRKSLIEDILQQLHHVEKLKIGSWLIKILSTKKVGGGFSRPLNIKCLIVDSPYLKKHHSRLAHLLHISPVLEKLVITVPRLRYKVNHKPGNNYWISNAIVFDCLVSHLKTLKIVVLSYEERDVRRQHMLNLVQFLLNNARVLEKMVVVVEDNGTGLALKVSQEFLSLSRCSQNAIVEVLYSKQIEKFL